MDFARFAAKLGGSESFCSEYFFVGFSLYSRGLDSRWDSRYGCYRELPRVFVYTFTVDELRAVEKRYKAQVVADSAAATTKATAAYFRAAWIASLPDAAEVPWTYRDKTGVTSYQINKAAGEIELNGEYYLPIPAKPVQDIVKYIRDNEYVPE